jgi:hypothetical protein
MQIPKADVRSYDEERLAECVQGLPEMGGERATARVSNEYEERNRPTACPLVSQNRHVPPSTPCAPPKLIQRASAAVPEGNRAHSRYGEPVRCSWHTMRLIFGGDKFGDGASPDARTR